MGGEGGKSRGGEGKWKGRRGAERGEGREVGTGPPIG